MCLFVFPVKIVLLLSENGEVILVHSIFLVEGVFPDKAALLPVLRDHGIAEDLPAFVRCVQIEHEDSAGIQIIVGQTQNLQKILLGLQIIDRIADAHDGPNRAIKFKLSHILL